MKTAIRILTLVLFLMPLVSNAQGRGFDYDAHRKMNKKAGKWGKNRVKASKGDYTNMQCSVGKTRRHARRSRD